MKTRFHSLAHPYLRAIAYALAGFTLWVMGDTSLKLIGSHAPPKYEIMTIGCLSGATVIFLSTLLRGKIQRLRPHHYGKLVIQGLLNLTGYLTWLIALPHLPLANCYIVMFLSPMLVAIFAAIFLNERLKYTDGIAIVIGFIGVTIAVNPRSLLHNHRELLSYGSIFIALLATALQMILLRILGRRESRESTVFYPRMVTAIAGLLIVFVWGFEPVSMRALLFSLLSGVLGSVGWMCMAEAYKTAPATMVAPFHYSQILSGAFFGYMFWGDVPSRGLWMGAALIIVSGIYIVTHARKSAIVLKTETHA